MDIVPPSRPRGSHARLSSKTNVAVTLPVVVLHLSSYGCE